jgi:hypothetical protein
MVIIHYIISTYERRVIWIDIKDDERTSGLWFRSNIGGFLKVLMLGTTGFGPVRLRIVI